mmetsp:Transcript_25015/g.79279  ORF Transcript_25015/g.79279 Transcript_25015/m.79279 type:complete len:221 (-) Transcript_25015:573-1235(-)
MLPMRSKTSEVLMSLEWKCASPSLKEGVLLPSWNSAAAAPRRGERGSRSLPKESSSVLRRSSCRFAPPPMMASSGSLKLPTVFGGGTRLGRPLGPPGPPASAAGICPPDRRPFSRGCEAGSARPPGGGPGEWPPSGSTERRAKRGGVAPPCPPPGVPAAGAGEPAGCAGWFPEPRGGLSGVAPPPSPPRLSLCAMCPEEGRPSHGREWSRSQWNGHCWGC